MNNPSPLIPQGSLLEQKAKSRSRLKTAFFCVLAINVIPLVLALLVQGCRKPQEPDQPQADTNSVATPTIENTNITAVDTNMPATNAAPTAVAPAVPEPVTPAVTPGAAQEYVVAKGDSFYTIAKKFGVTMKAIEAANPNVEPKKLKIGQKLQIPAPAPAATSGTAVAPATPAADAGTSGEQVYTVKSGDTLTTIAKHTGTTVKALRSENSLTTDKIKVGQKLKIPAKSVAPVETTPAPPAAPATPAPAASGTKGA
jgi:LysM repeat protein